MENIKSEEFKRVILEVGECLKSGKITRTFQVILNLYEQEIKETKKEKKDG